MLRSLLLYLSEAGWVKRFVTRFPLARRVARRFVAGETPDEAIGAVRDLNAHGIAASVDYLGENVYTTEEAERAVEDYLHILNKIDQAGVTANVSLKLTHLGLDLGESVCVNNLLRILEHARRQGNFVRIDMEGSDYTERTLAVFRTLRHEHGFDNVGIVIQSYLYRSEGDIAALVEEGARVRLCKGAYQEPPDLAFPRKSDVDANYVKLARRLLEGAAHSAENKARKRAAGRDAPATPGAARTMESKNAKLMAGRDAPATRGADAPEGVYGNRKIPPLPGLATHDHKMIEAARACALELDLPHNRFEFQMLYGIRRELQTKLIADGFQLRVYVPYGSQWYPYFMRRLAERPANLWFFLTALFRG